jgi:hypothetical protein
MTKPNVIIKDCQTGEELVREMTDAEYAELLAAQEKEAAAQAKKALELEA